MTPKSVLFSEEEPDSCGEDFLMSAISAVYASLACSSNI